MLATRIKGRSPVKKAVTYGVNTTLNIKQLAKHKETNPIKVKNTFGYSFICPVNTIPIKMRPIITEDKYPPFEIRLQIELKKELKKVAKIRHLINKSLPFLLVFKPTFLMICIFITTPLVITYILLNIKITTLYILNIISKTILLNFRGTLRLFLLKNKSLKRGFLLNSSYCTIAS